MPDNKSFTLRFARALATAAGQRWDVLTPLDRLAWIGRALGRMLELYDAREARRK